MRIAAVASVLLLAVGAVRLAAVAAVGRRSRAFTTDAAGVQPAVERGFAFIRKNGAVHSASDLSALMVLDYLQRRYALAPDLAFSEWTALAHSPDDRRLWGRFVGVQRPVDAATLGTLAGRPSIDAVVMHALYCDQVPLPAAYGSVLRQFAERGGYELTHASLALEIVRDNRCSLEAPDEGTLEELLRRRLRSLLARAPADPRYEELDVRYEALAVLEDFLGTRDVPSALVARVLRDQQPDGGWKPQGDQVSALHPTVMAVWALLVSIHPDAPAIRFAR